MSCYAKPTELGGAASSAAWAESVNGHREIGVGGQVISWLAVTGIPGGWPCDLLAGSGQGNHSLSG
jgi:hypothetical protein